MALGPRLDLRQSQSLVMTPQLQQAIRLLALSNLEIESFISEELERNPLLEATAQESDGPVQDALPSAPAADPVAADRLLDGSGSQQDNMDVDYSAETFHHDSAADSAGGLDGGLGLNGGSGAGSSEDGPDFDSFAADAPSLHHVLMEQAQLSLSGTTLIIALHLIDLIDEAGYFTGHLLDCANRLGVALVQVEAALAAIQGFEPTGVGARTLSECLALQAREADRFDPAMARLIDNLDVLAQGRIAQLMRMCGVDAEDMADMIRELRAYDPKPGLRFGGERTLAVTPDVYVAERADGWAVEINSGSLPRLLVNQRYYSEMSSAGGRDKTTKSWLNDCMASANWLVKAMDQRQRTIIRVTSEIVKQQEGFFRHGVSRLKPLTLRQVAEAVDLHESTISRVTSNKYLSCARGLFELKYFFTSGIAATDGGDAASAEAVKSAIRTLISAEDAVAILSDDTLVEMLKAQGFDIARRTVAKYREAMGIGSSVQRRRAKAINARAA